jgi:hypothetical protein
MIACVPSMDTLVLKTNIPIIVRNSTHNLVPYVRLPIRQSFVFLLSLAIVLPLLLGAGLVFVSRNLPVQSPQPLRRRHLPLDLHAIAESHLCLTTKINADAGFGDDLYFLVLEGREVDVVVLAFANQRSTSNLGIGRQLVKPVTTFSALVS